MKSGGVSGEAAGGQRPGDGPHMAPARDEHNELTDGLKTDEEETWKKKVMYD